MDPLRPVLTGERPADEKFMGINSMDANSVLLIYAQRIVPGRTFEYVGNLGTITLAAQLCQRGYQARAFTGLTTDAARLIEAHLDGLFAVCFYCDFDNQTAVASLCRMVKARTRALAIVGGPQTLHMNRLSLQVLGADAILAGEGEQILGDYLDARRQGRTAQIPGLMENTETSWLPDRPRPGLANPDQLQQPEPAGPDHGQQPESAGPVFVQLSDLTGLVYPRDDLNWPGPVPVLSIISARGCPYRCAFCFEGGCSKDLRSRPVTDVLTELDYRLATRDGPTYVLFQDDTFTTSATRLDALLDGLRRLRGKYDFVWFCEGHASFFDRYPDAMRAMVGSGMVRMQIGMESGSQKVLDAYDKRITPLLVRKVAELAWEAGLPQLAGNFIIGGAFEDRETLAATERFLLSLVRDFPGLIEPSTTFLMPLPGTRVTNEPESLGLFFDDLDFVTGLEDYPVNHTAALSRWDLCTLRRSLLSKVLDLMRCQFERGEIPERFILSSFALNCRYHLVNAYLRHVYTRDQAAAASWAWRARAWQMIGALPAAVCTPCLRLNDA